MSDTLRNKGRNWLGGPLWRRLARVHSNHKRIAAGAVLIGVLTIIAKVFVAGREITIAWRYGVSGTVDAYQLSLTLTSWLPMMFLSVMTSVFVPLLIALRSNSEERRQFISELNGTILLVGVALSAITWLASPLVSHLFGSTDRRPIQDLTVALCRTMSPIGFLLTWIGYLSVRLQARERFTYTVTEAIPAVVIALAVASPMIAPAQERLGWSTTIGYLAQLLMLVAMTHSMDQGVGGLDFRHRAPQWAKLYRNLGIMVVGQVVMALAIPIDQAFAVRIGPGAVATLGYANRIILLIVGLGSVMLARALLPVLSRTIAEGHAGLAVRQARHWAWLLFAAAFALAILIWMLAYLGVSIVFERGAFTSRDASAVAEVLQLGTLQLPFFFAGLVLVQWYAACEKYNVLALSTIAGIAIKLILNFLLVPRLGIHGIMLSTAGMYLVILLFLVTDQLASQSVRRLEAQA